MSSRHTHFNHVWLDDVTASVNGFSKMDRNETHFGNSFTNSNNYLASMNFTSLTI